MEYEGPLGRQPQTPDQPFLVAPPTSFKDCIPRSFQLQIRRHNALTRLRLRNIFRRFVRAFQPGHVSQQVVMVKYLATLEQLAPRFGTERLPVCHLELLAQAVGQPYYLRDAGQSPPEPGPELATGPPTHEVLVTGTGGIQWRPVRAEVSRVPLPSSGPGRAGAGAPAQPWPWPPRVALGYMSVCPVWLWDICLSVLWGGFLGNVLCVSPLGTSEEPLSGIWG